MSKKEVILAAALKLFSLTPDAKLLDIAKVADVATAEVSSLRRSGRTWRGLAGLGTSG